MPAVDIAPARPTRMVGVAAARLRFGDAVDLVAELQRAGDPLADAAVAAGVTRARFADALRPGAVPAPGPAADLAAQLGAVPAWVDPDRLRRGSDAYLGIGATWMQLLLGPGSLVNTYRSPGLARVLTASGRLDGAVAARRIEETGSWLGAAVQPGALAAGEPGHVATAQVRLLHAHIRHHLLAHGWDVDAWGVPINQSDLLRTLLDFTYVPINAMHRLGVGLDARQRDDVYHLFRYIGHLLGLDPRLHADDHEQATGLAALLDSVDAPPDEHSGRLVDALLTAYDELLSPEIHTPPAVTRQLVLALARAFHGPDLCRRVGMADPAPWANAAVRSLGWANSAARLVHRAVPAARRRAVRRAVDSIHAHEGLLGGPALYQES